MSKEFYEWIFKNSPGRWDSPVGHQGVDDFIKKSLELFEGLPLTIVDLGCGNGRTIEHIYRPEWKITGVDYITGAIEAAKKKVGDKATFVVGDMTNTGLPSESFDVVYSCGAFEHLDEPNFDEPYRLLKNGGLFLCTVCIGDRGKVETEFCHQPGTPNWGKQWEWELPVEKWTELLQKSNFEVISQNGDAFVCQGLEKK